MRALMIVPARDLRRDVTNVVVHLRLPVQLTLAPLYLWGVFAAGGRWSAATVGGFVVVHLFLQDLHVVFGHVLDDLIDLHVDGVARHQLDDAVNVGAGADDGLDGAFGLAAKFVEQEDVVRIGHADDQRVAVETKRDDEILADVIRLKQGERLLVDRGPFGNFKREAQLLRLRAEHLRLGGGVHRQEDLGDALARRLRLHISRVSRWPGPRELPREYRCQSS